MTIAYLQEVKTKSYSKNAISWKKILWFHNPLLIFDTFTYKFNNALPQKNSLHTNFNINHEKNSTTPIHKSRHPGLVSPRFFVSVVVPFPRPRELGGDPTRVKISALYCWRSGGTWLLLPGPSFFFSLLLSDDLVFVIACRNASELNGMATFSCN